MAQGALVAVPFPETAVIDRATLEDQTAAIASVLPERPLVLGGCCCSHIGAVRGLAERHGRLSVVWVDAHGDVNTPETSPSGNRWGMALRMILDDGLAAPADAALIGARNLDPPEVEYLEAVGIDDSFERALEGSDGVYVAFDLDVLDPAEAEVHFPEPAGMSLGAAETLLRELADSGRIVGMGMTGFLPSERNVGVIAGLAAAAGLA
jgi:arginase